MVIDVIQTFGDFIIVKQRERNKSAKQLADELGISATYLCDIEKAHSLQARYIQNFSSNVAFVRAWTAKPGGWTT